MMRATYLALVVPTLFIAVFGGAFWASRAVHAPESRSLFAKCEALQGEWLHKSARPICVRDGELLVYEEILDEFLPAAHFFTTNSDSSTTSLNTSAAVTDICTQNFTDFQVTEFYTGSPRVDFATLPEATRHRTAITKDINQGVNFAGTYVVATWGCGLECRGNAVINAQSGAILAYDLRSLVGEAFERDSDLLILDPGTITNRTFVIEDNNADSERLLEICTD